MDGNLAMANDQVNMTEAQMAELGDKYYASVDVANGKDSEVTIIAFDDHFRIVEPKPEEPIFEEWQDYLMGLVCKHFNIQSSVVITTNHKIKLPRKLKKKLKMHGLYVLMKFNKLHYIK